MLLHISFKTDLVNILKQFLLRFPEANKVLSLSPFLPFFFFFFFPCFWAGGADCTKVRDEPELEPETWILQDLASGPSLVPPASLPWLPLFPKGARPALGVWDVAGWEPDPKPPSAHSQGGLRTKTCTYTPCSGSSLTIVQNLELMTSSFDSSDCRNFP